MRRSRRYSCPRSRAAVTAGEPPVARSYARSPSRTQIVVWKDPRVEPRSRSQFHPPSASCSPNSWAAMPCTSSPKYAPTATTRPLMHGSTSPAKRGLPCQAASCGSTPCHLTLARTRATARRAAALVGSSPRSHNNSSVRSETHSGWAVPAPQYPSAPWPVRTGGALWADAAGAGGRRAAPVHQPNVLGLWGGGAHVVVCADLSLSPLWAAPGPRPHAAVVIWEVGL